MKKFVLLTTLIILMVATFVQAHEEESDLNKFLDIDTEGLSQAETTEAEKDAMIANVDSVSKKANEHFTDMPNLVKTLLGTTSANVYLDGGDVLGLTIEDGKISAIQESAVENPTFNVHVSDTVFVYLNNNAFDLKTALNNNDITFEGVGFVGRIKSGMLKTTLTLIGL